ncbi:MAG: NTPase [Dehalococcoidia bacterium]|nr:MAG: NTPase [Dehalococcoidia bacterium]
MKKAYLLTGGPGVGKTTIIKQAIGNLQGKAGGFYTEEIRAGGARQGFRIVTLDGQSATLAHIDIKSPYRVSKYGVDMEGLDRVGVSALREATRQCDLVVIDEIGKMELFSPYFKEAVLEAINSEKRVLGTIMLTSHPWADLIKRHPNVVTITVTRMNQQQVLEQVLEWLKAPN